MTGVHTLSRCASLRRARGMTLIELVVTVAILGMLMMVAVPSFNDAILSNKLSSMSNSFSAAAQIARSEAIKRNATASTPVKLCRSTNGTSCAGTGGWEQGWIVFNDTDNDGAIDADETLVFRQTEFPSGFYFTGDAYTVTFLGTGTNGAGMNLNFKVCRHSPSVGEQDRAIVVGTTGRVTITKANTGTCISA